MTRPGDLLYEDEFDALERMLTYSGKSRKEVAAFLFPDRTPASGYARLCACMDPDGDQRLTFGQTLRAMQFCGAFDPLLYLAQATGHSRPQPLVRRPDNASLAESLERIAGAVEALRPLINLTTKETE